MKQRIQQLRSILRKEHLEKEFERRRRDLLSHPIEVESIQEPNTHLSKLFQQILDTINQALHQQNNQIALQYSDRLIKIVQSNPYASTCLFIHSLKVSELIQLVFKNEVINQNNSKYQLLFPQMQMRMTDCILEVLYKINYNSLDEDTYFRILKSFWLILTAKNINVQCNEGLFVLQKTVLIILKMMSRPNEIVFKHLKQLGIGSKIVELIEDLRLIQKDRLCQIFSEMISLYLQHENLFQREKGCQINGVHIMGMESNQKGHLLAFCLGLLKSEQPKILENSLSAIQIILLKFEYFAHSIPKQQVKRLCQLLERNQRNLQRGILSIIDTLVYHSAEQIMPYIKSLMLLDFMELQLRYQLKHKDHLTSTIVQKCANIICNITYEPSKQLKKALYQHSIWQLIFNNLFLQSSLFPLIVTFQYFFEFIPRNKLLACLQSYCEAVGQLQLKLVEQRYKDNIRQTLLRIFYIIRDFYSEGMLQKFVSIVESNKLRDFLAEQIDAIMLQQL